MNAATHPPRHRELRSLVVLGEAGELQLATFAELAAFIEPGSLVVVNDAATLPASVQGVAELDDADLRIELRLARRHEDESWSAILLAEGDWHQRTEARTELPHLPEGTRLRFGSLVAEVIEVDPEHARLVRVEFKVRGHAFLEALYREGEVIQYSYLDEDLDLWSPQTLFAGRPWAVEMPSAGHPLNAQLLGALRERGVEIRTLTHAAGISSTGDAALDARLPFPERYDIPHETAEAISRARREGRPVLAVGTTVVRALESAAFDCDAGHCINGGEGLATLKLGPESKLRTVDGILTGLHLPGESHFELLRAFAPREDLERSIDLARRAGLRNHEFGDVALIRSRGRT